MDYPYRPGDTLGAPGPQPGGDTLGRPPMSGPVQSPPLGPSQGGPMGVVQPPWGPAQGGPMGQPMAPGPQPGLTGGQPGWQGPPQGGFSGPTRPSTIPPSGGPGMGQRPMAGPGPGMGQPYGAGGGQLGRQKRVFGLVTPEAVLSYPALFQPKTARGANKAKYQAALIFMPGTDLRELFELVQAAAVDGFGPEAAEQLRVGMLKWPVRRGEEKGYPPGSFFINARSDYQPGCVSRYRGPDGKPMIITDPSQLYPGALVRADINAYAFNTSGNRGVAWGLNGIQKLGDGPRLDNRKSAQDRFEAFDDAPADFGGQWGAPQWGAPPPPPPANWNGGQPQWQQPPQQQWPQQQPQQPQQQWPQQQPQQQPGGYPGALGPNAPWR